jgi:hypothetical protein
MSWRRRIVADVEAGVKSATERRPSRGLVGRPMERTNRIAGRLARLATTLRCMLTS